MNGTERLRQRLREALWEPTSTAARAPALRASPRRLNRGEKRGWSPERGCKSRAAQGGRTPPHTAAASRRSSALPKMAAPVAAARPALPARKMAASGRGGAAPRVTLRSANGGRGGAARPGSCGFRFFFFFLPGRV